MTEIAALTPRPDVLAFLLNRRSRPAKTLGLPVPDRSTVETLLQAAARSPDHGKLEPWRFIVLERAACLRLADLTADRGAEAGMDPEKVEKSRRSFADAHLVVAGWGANWLSGWMAMDRAFLARGLDLEPHEFVAGFIHLGREGAIPPERPRPDMSRITDWVSE